MLGIRQGELGVVLTDPGPSPGRGVPFVSVRFGDEQLSVDAWLSVNELREVDPLVELAKACDEWEEP